MIYQTKETDSADKKVSAVFTSYENCCLSRRFSVRYHTCKVQYGRVKKEWGLVMKKRRKSGKILRGFSWILFIIYLVIMVYFLFFCERFGRVPSDEYHYNLDPFAEIKRYIRHIQDIGYFYVIINLVGNVVCFMPLGVVLPILSNYKWGVFRITCVSFFASVIIELIQLVSKLGSCDVDDIFMNTCGGLLGYILYLICTRIYRVMQRRSKNHNLHINKR